MKKIERESKYPKGYWTSVFKEVKRLIDANKKLDGDTAYKIARNNIDATLPQAKLSL